MTQAMKNRRVFRLETLEDRTLLAGLVDPALEGYEVAWGNNEGVDVSYTPVSFDDPDTQERLSFSGSEETDLIVNVDLLPETVTQLFFSSMANVQIVGERDIGLVYAQDLQSLDIQTDVELDSSSDFFSHLFTVDVPSITFGGETPNFMLLEGDSVTLNSSVDDFGQDGIVARVKNLEFFAGGVSVASEDISLVRLATLPDDPVEVDVSDPGSVEPEIVESPLDSDELLLIQQAIELLDNANGSGVSDIESIRLALIEVSQGAQDSEDPQTLDFELTILSQNYSIAGSLQFDTETVFTDSGFSTEYASSDPFIETSEILPVENSIGDISIFIEEPAFIGPVLPEGALTQPAILEFTPTEESAVQEQHLQPTIETATDKLFALVAKTQTAASSLKSHVLSKIADEFTPGERVGLIVDTKGPTIKRSFDSHLTI